MPFKTISKTILKIFGSRNERLVKSYSSITQQAASFEEQIQALDDTALCSKTTEFKDRLKNGASPSDILPEAFAVVREAARRNVQMRHFDVQLIGGNVLYDGKIAEMATGEGKTLAATLATYLVHLTGRRVHIVTVNDYLAKRDAEWMGPIYKALGLSVGAIQADMDTAGGDRKGQYLCDITYGTNNEFGFDYLRDNMKISLEQMVQSELQYAIIDEVDSILIDEARTPLIISGPTYDINKIEKYLKANEVTLKLIKQQEKECGPTDKIDYDKITPRSSLKSLIPSGDAPFTDSGSLGGKLLDVNKRQSELEKELKRANQELSHSRKTNNQNSLEKILKEIDNLKEEFAANEQTIEQIKQEAWLSGAQATPYFDIDYKSRSVQLTERGVATAQKIVGVGSFFTGSGMEWPHLLEQSLRAHLIYEKEKDYVVMDGKVIIVDEFTGRLMHGRQWSDGLHQAVEAKERVKIKEETQTLATITLQNFFKLYDQIAGMTGTAATEAEEFMRIYKLDVVTIPQNKQCIRDDRDDMIYKTRPEKLDAIVEEIETASADGRPVLVGTTSVERNIELSEAMKQRYGKEYQHEILNAKNHAREALIIEKAGQQHTDRSGANRGNITIATNMAGRGTDIKLAPGVAGIGGLHVIGTERHEARRIDNQLRGRCGRQGDPGSSVFFVSFEDDLMKIFAPEWAVKALSWIGWEKGQSIYHPRISKGIERAQKKVEERNFEIRKNLLEYDEVMDQQRKIFYTRRREILRGKGLGDIVLGMVSSTIARYSQTVLDKRYPLNCIIEWAKLDFDVDLKINDVSDADPDLIENLIKERARENAASNISLSVSEYLEDYGDPDARGSRDISGLCKWAYSAFGVGLSPQQVKKMTREEIEDTLTEKAGKQIDDKDCSALRTLLNKDFAVTKFVKWIRDQFNLNLTAEQLRTMGPSGATEHVIRQVKQKYKKLEIEYPVELMMRKTYQQQTPNIYAFELLADWANKKYNANFSADGLQDMEPGAVYKQLLELSKGFNNGKLDQEITDKITRLNTPELAKWANSRYNASLSEQNLGEGPERKNRLLEVAREFLRSELGNLEKYVLVHVYDSSWKDNLYAMDHLKEGIHFRALAEKDPKVEYKRESIQMFQQMLDRIEDQVTYNIFRITPEVSEEPGTSSVWTISQTSHDQMHQFEASERQHQAAQAPQGEVQVKQIVHDKPRVGRNDPCPCGSGKKYKKCCGKNA